MKRFLLHNWPWKLASLIIAILLWALVHREPEVATFVSIPVQYKRLPGDLEISSELVESVYLELHGPSPQLRDVAESRRYAVVLDLSNVRPGERTFTVGKDNIALPPGLHLARAVPSQIRLHFEPGETRAVPVDVRLAGGPQSNYEVNGMEVQPRALRVVGPRSRVENLRSVTTDAVDLRSVVGASEFRVHAFVDDPHVRFLDAPVVTVRVRIKRK